MTSSPIVIAAAGLLAGISLGFLFGHQASPVGEARAQAGEAGEPEAGPAYMIVMGTVHDREAFGRGYAAKLPPLYARHGGEYLALTGSVETLEGETGFQSLVLSRWPDAESARAFWADPEYRALAEARQDNDWGDFHVVLVEGLPAPAIDSPMSRAAEADGDGGE